MRWAATVSLGLAAALVTAAPSAAGSSVEASNFQTRLVSVTPAVRGLAFSVIEVGNRLEVVNRTGTEVVVLGYEDEPYLRVGPDGVFENARSPATYLNRDRQATAPVPADADPTATPEWRRIGPGPVVRWYDHRAHWMGAEPPPAVRQEPHVRHVIIPEWTVPLRHGERVVTAAGELVWVPGPSPVPWLMLAALPMGALALAWGAARWTGRRGHPGRLLAAGLATAVVLSATAALGREGPLPLPGALPLVAAWALGAVALVLLVGRHRGGPALALVSMAGVIAFGAIPGLDDLSRSQVPTHLPVPLARAAVALGLGAGTAVALAASAAARAARPKPIEAGPPSL